jgi:hypothetical protein
MQHDFNLLSIKTANKDGQKYLNKQGGQAWRVSTKIGDEWYSNMIWDEEMLPVKGKKYNIELSENEGYKNWDYKLLSKKEQIIGKALSDTINEVDGNEIMPPMPTEKIIDEPKPRDFSEEARGKTRCQVAVAYISANRTLNESSKEEMNAWVDYIFNGK